MRLPVSKTIVCIALSDPDCNSIVSIMNIEDALFTFERILQQWDCGK